MHTRTHTGGANWLDKLTVAANASSVVRKVHAVGGKPCACVCVGVCVGVCVSVCVLCKCACDSVFLCAMCVRDVEGVWCTRCIFVCDVCVGCGEWGEGTDVQGARRWR